MHLDTHLDYKSSGLNLLTYASCNLKWNIFVSHKVNHLDFHKEGLDQLPFVCEVNYV